MAQKTRRQERDQSTTIHPVPVAARGISDQPPHLRLPGQMEDARNCHVSVIDGTSKRPGTEYMTPITLDGGANWREFKLEFDESEQYVGVFGFPASDPNATVRIFRVASTINWTEATVTIAAAAQTYLNQGNADTLRFRPISKDETLIICTNVVASTAAAATFTLTGTFRDYGIMVAQTPADNTYHRALTEDIDENKPAGYYKYSVSGVTFAKIQFAPVTGQFASVTGIYDNSGSSPMGFTIRCRKYDLAVAGATWTEATKTLTKAGAFTNYFPLIQAGEEFHISSGTGATPGYYAIVSGTANTLVFATSIGAGANGQVDIAGTNGVSVTYDVQRATDGVALVDMYAVAESFQDAFRAAGADNGLIGWTPVGGTSGYFSLTSPFRGAGASILEIGAPSAGTTLAAAGNPFYFAGGTPTAGAGSGSLTLDVANRWTQVSPSGAADGSIDSTTFPVKLLRTAANTFRIDPITPTPRMSGDGTTNPSPSIFRKAGTISAVTATNPASLTSLSHARRTGDVVTTAGLGLVAGSANGTFPVTVIDGDTFTIPVDASAGVTDGVGTWTSGGAAIFDAAIHRGRLGLFGGSFSCFSRVRDYFNFYVADYRNIVDDDPIDAPIGAREVVNIDFVQELNGRLIAFSKGAKQYEFGLPEALTPSTASWTGRTTNATYSICPVQMDAYVYFLGPRTNKSVAWEYRYDGLQTQYTAGEITAHCRDLLPMALRSLAAGVNEGVLLVLPAGNGSTSKLFVYRAFWDGADKQQSEWVEYVFDPGVRICDVVVIKGDAYLLTETTGLITDITTNADTTVTTQTNHGLANGNTVYISESQSTPSLDGARIVRNVTANTFQINPAFNVTAGATSSLGVGRWSNTDYMIEKLSLSREDPKTGYPYTIHLDRRLELTGVFGGVNTVWTLPFPAQGSTLNKVVLKTSGTIVDLAAAVYAGNTITLAGNFAGIGYLGRNFDFRLQLTPPYFKDSNGIPDQQVAILLNRIVIAYLNAGDFSVRVDYDDARADVTNTFTPTAVIESGRFQAWTLGDGEHMTVFIESNSPKQLTIAGFQQQGDYAFGLR